MGFVGMLLAPGANSGRGKRIHRDSFASIFFQGGKMMKLRTINQTHREHPEIPAYRMRVWLKEGKLPGFWANSRFYVDVNRLMTRLDALCENNGQLPERGKRIEEQTEVENVNET